MKILLVEDDLPLSRGIEKALLDEGFAVDSVYTGREALASVDMLEADLVVLDLGLPDIDGTAVLRQLRKTQPALPVMILTARDGLDDKVGALDSGADDYLCKPFAIPEFLARLRVLARRLGTAATSTIGIGEVVMDVAGHRVIAAGSEVPLTRREYMVLKALMENAGRIQTKEAMESKLYGWGEEIASNTIEVHISNLRKKLPAGFIQTIRGVGYTITRPAN